MYLLRIMCLLLALTALTPPSQAQTSDPDFQTAVDAWLQDNDAVALPLLSKLAKVGNEDAMILLGVLNRLPGKLSPYLASLSRKERNAILRAPGGLSGKSWLTRVVEQKVLAQALIDKNRIEGRYEAILYLLDHGETEIAVDPLLAMVPYRPRNKLLNLYKLPNFPHQVWVLLLSGLYESNTNYFTDEIWKHGVDLLKEKRVQGLIFARSHARLPQSKAAQLARHIGKVLKNGDGYTYLPDAFDKFGTLHPKRLSELEKAEIRGLARDAVMNDPETRPIVELCKVSCSDQVAQCTQAVFSLIGGYSGFVRVHTPIERYISKDSFDKSPRFAAQLSRQADPIGVSWHKQKPISQCAAKLFASQ